MPSAERPGCVIRRVLSIDEQVELFDRHLATALPMVQRKVARRIEHCARLARERMVSVGAEEYGDATWHLPLADVERAFDEEIADAIFYVVVEAAKVERIDALIAAPVDADSDPAATERA